MSFFGDLFHTTLKYLLDIISPISGWCETLGHLPTSVTDPRNDHIESQVMPTPHRRTRESPVGRTLSKRKTQLEKWWTYGLIDMYWYWYVLIYIYICMCSVPISNNLNISISLMTYHDNRRPCQFQLLQSKTWRGQNTLCSPHHLCCSEPGWWFKTETWQDHGRLRPERYKWGFTWIYFKTLHFSQLNHQAKIGILAFFSQS